MQKCDELGSGISPHRATFGGVTKSTSVKSIFLQEINFAFVVQLLTLYPNDNIKTDASEK